MKMVPKTVEEILQKSGNKKTIECLRRLIKESIPTADERVKRGNIVYMLNGRDFLRIHSYKTHADLGFANGKRLASLLLKRRGRGGSWRHLEIKSPEDSENFEVKRLVERAAELFSL